MDTVKSLRATSGGEVKMGNVSSELPILDRTAIRVF